MDKNYTPLDIASFQKKEPLKKSAQNESFDINAVFLTLIIVTLLVMAVLLFILIQKKVQELGFGLSINPMIA